jgi:hypothetical protein
VFLATKPKNYQWYKTGYIVGWNNPDTPYLEKFLLTIIGFEGYIKTPYGNPDMALPYTWTIVLSDTM